MSSTFAHGTAEWEFVEHNAGLPVSLPLPSLNGWAIALLVAGLAAVFGTTLLRRGRY